MYKFSKIPLIIIITAFSILMLTKILPYLQSSDFLGFLSTKTNEVIAKNYYRVAFYVHITSSWWVMLGGIFQFTNQPFGKYHKILGKIYVISILFLAAPSGLVLAFFANGGISAKVGFTMQCIVWWFVTYKAFQEIKNKNWQAHIDWMLRSYAVTLAAMSLRLGSYMMVYFLGTKPIETYLTVTWLSWVGNLFIIEVLISNGLGLYLFQKLKK
jgi:Predicted membrane protein (DUF2306)